VKNNVAKLFNQDITAKEAEDSVKTLLSWIGENPEREGLIETPARVIKSYNELFSGYKLEPEQILQKTFEDTEGFTGEVILKDIPFSSMCEHHMLPFVGKAHIAYLPAGRIVGLSKMARLVEIFARRLQVQERLTAQVSETLQKVLQPKGVAVVIEAEHYCLAMRGANKRNSVMITSHFSGVLEHDLDKRRHILDMINR
jgi:GTP cyclohydrolase I